VQFTKEIQSTQAQAMANNYLTQQVAHMEGDISMLEQRFRGVAVAPQLTNKVSEVGTNLSALGQHLATAPGPTSMVTARLAERLNKATEELYDLQQKYTDLHWEIGRASCRERG